MNSKLIAYRKLLNLSQKDLAKKLNKSLTTYNRKEVGKIEFTQNEMIIITRVIKKYIPNITMDEIFFENNIGKMLS